MKCFAKNERQESRVNAAKHASGSNSSLPHPHWMKRERFNDSGTRRRTHTKCIIMLYGVWWTGSSSSRLVHIMHRCTISHEIYVALHRFSSKIRMYKQNEVCKCSMAKVHTAVNWERERERVWFTVVHTLEHPRLLYQTKTTPIHPLINSQAKTQCTKKNSMIMNLTSTNKKRTTTHNNSSSSSSNGNLYCCLPGNVISTNVWNLMSIQHTKQRNQQQPRLLQEIKFPLHPHKDSTRKKTTQKTT